MFGGLFGKKKAEPESGLLRKETDPLSRTGYIVTEGKQIPFSVRRYPKSKGIRLIVTEDAKVKVTAPMFVGRQAIDMFLKAHKMWILQQVSYYERLIEINKDKQFERLLYLGRVYPILFEKSEKPFVEKQTFNILVRTPNQSNHEVREALQVWYKNQTMRIILEILMKHNLNLDINRISIRDQKTCWGSASSKNNINFNWKLAMTPYEVIEYVVIHELSHLKHMNHSEDFWKEVSKYCPNYKDQKKWLIDNRDLLKL